MSTVIKASDIKESVIDSLCEGLLPKELEFFRSYYERNWEDLIKNVRTNPLNNGFRGLELKEELLRRGIDLSTLIF